MSEIILDPQQAAAWQVIGASLPAFESWGRGWRGLKWLQTQPRSLYLHGPVGRGKSMLMKRLYETCTLPEPVKRRIHFYDFMAEVNRQLQNLGQDHAASRSPPLVRLSRNIARQTRLLCFDELVINNIADAMILGRLIPQLISDGVVIIATSNFPPERLYEKGLLRERFTPLIRLIEEQFDLLDLGVGIDWRRSRRALPDSWLVPPDPQRLNQIWRALIAPESPQPLQIHTSGRIVTIDQVAAITQKDSPFVGRAARFNFADLCLVAYGPNDYLAITQAMGVILVDDIPQFTAADSDSARRFITLVDCLYEANCGLIATSHCAIDSLYPESSITAVGFPAPAESRRCQSRLHEILAQST
ncbi:MAG: cell division protein ZapE, partial [Alphaproteobacteria bacterium]|nr:cell division protein ZapE [Alphaproteobacteria bacterium]